MIERFAMKNRSALIFTFLLTFWTSATQAGPGAGLGLFLDFGQLKPVNDASGREYQDSKVIGDQIDYQFALGNSFSFLLFASENANKGSLPANTKYGYYKVGILGAEFRAWMGPLFIGVHLSLIHI